MVIEQRVQSAKKFRKEIIIITGIIHWIFVNQGVPRNLKFDQFMLLFMHGGAEEKKAHMQVLITKPP